jgi:hypothetical protein
MDWGDLMDIILVKNLFHLDILIVYLIAIGSNDMSRLVPVQHAEPVVCIVAKAQLYSREGGEVSWGEPTTCTSWAQLNAEEDYVLLTAVHMVTLKEQTTLSFYSQSMRCKQCSL